MTIHFGNLGKVSSSLRRSADFLTPFLSIISNFIINKVRYLHLIDTGNIKIEELYEGVAEVPSIHHRHPVGSGRGARGSGGRCRGVVPDAIKNKFIRIRAATLRPALDTAAGVDKIIYRGTKQT